MLSLTCNNTACSGIREPNAVAFTSIFYCERSKPLVCGIARAVYIYIYIYIIVRTSFRKCTPFLNSEYNFQFYRRVIINLQQYRVRRNPRAQRRSVLILVGEQSEPHTYRTAAKNLRHIYIYVFYIYIYMYIYIIIIIIIIILTHTPIIQVQKKKFKII